MRRLETLIPPPAVLLVTLISMFVITRFDDARILRTDGSVLNSLIACALVVIGIAISIMGIKELRRTQTTINPQKLGTASNLVMTGVFKFTRNPIYLGMLFVALSAVAFYGSAWCLVAVLMYFAYVTRFQILPEERAMTSLFGDKYEAYRAVTRRWI